MKVKESENEFCALLDHLNHDHTPRRSRFACLGLDCQPMTMTVTFVGILSFIGLAAGGGASASNMLHSFLVIISETFIWQLTGVYPLIIEV